MCCRASGARGAASAADGQRFDILSTHGSLAQQQQSHLSEYCHDYSRYGASLESLKAAHGGLNPYCMSELSIQIATLTIASEFTGKLLEYASTSHSARTSTALCTQHSLPAVHGACYAGTPCRALRRAYVSSWRSKR